MSDFKLWERFSTAIKDQKGTDHQKENSSHDFSGACTPFRNRTHRTSYRISPADPAFALYTQRFFA
jgi:hypothetical protein